MIRATGLIKVATGPFLWLSQRAQCLTKHWIETASLINWVVTIDCSPSLQTKASSVKCNRLGLKKATAAEPASDEEHLHIASQRKANVKYTMWPITSHYSMGVMNEAEKSTVHGGPGKLRHLRPAEGQRHRLLHSGLPQSKSLLVFLWGASRCPGSVQRDVPKKTVFCSLLSSSGRHIAAGGYIQQWWYGEMELKGKFFINKAWRVNKHYEVCLKDGGSLWRSAWVGRQQYCWWSKDIKGILSYYRYCTQTSWSIWAPWRSHTQRETLIL
jgi:hypothetical protein